MHGHQCAISHLQKLVINLFIIIVDEVNVKLS
jgi:hypothetical protein